MPELINLAHAGRPLHHIDFQFVIERIFFQPRTGHDHKDLSEHSILFLMQCGCCLINLKRILYDSNAEIRQIKAV